MTKKILIFLLCVTIGISATVTLEEELNLTDHQLYEEAMKSIKNGDYNRAEELLQMVIPAQDDPVLLAKAMYAMGEYIAITRDHDYKKGFEILGLMYSLHEKAPHEVNKALKRLADAYSRGSLQVPRDVELAISCYEDLANQNYNHALKAYAMYRLGEVHRALTSDEYYDAYKAFKWFLKASKQNYDHSIKMNALLTLGEMVMIGEGAEKDFDRAVAYFERVVKESKDKRAHAKGLIELGTLYAMDNNKDFIPRLDMAKGLAYFHAVAQQDDDLSLKADALEHLGNVYLLGDREIKVDIKRAIKVITILADGDFGTFTQRGCAQLTLGDIYRFGLHGTPVDTQKAIKYYKKIKVWGKHDYEPELEKRLQWVKEQEAKK